MVRAALALFVLAQLAAASGIRVRLYQLTSITEIRVEMPGKQPFMLKKAAVLEPGTQLTVPGARPLTLDVPAAVTQSGGRLQITVLLEEDDYVARVMAGENGGFTSDESLKAMAVAIRSYARAKLGRHGKEGFDYCDTSHCQDLHFITKDRLRQAAAATTGEVLWYNNKPASAVYHQNCGGRTEAAAYVWPGVSMPYLASLTDTFCQSGKASAWQARISMTDLARALGRDHLYSLAVRSRTPTGRVTKLSGDGRVIDAEALHYAVGRNMRWGLLQSRSYELSVADGSALFTGTGAGHGVGMCQTGAMERAAAGQNYRQILAFYYPGTTLGVTPSGGTWTRVSTERADIWSVGAPDPSLASAIDRAAAEAETRTGRPMASRPAVRLYPSPSQFRDATGEPGWITASTVGHTVRLKTPYAQQALVHEMTHVALNERTRRPVPVWFAEGLAYALDQPHKIAATVSGSESQLVNPKTEAEYRQGCLWAAARVSGLLERYGKEVTLSWLEKGLPADLR
jgi:stage II sporulation protein D